MDGEIITAAMVAVVTGIITGIISSASTISSLRVHIEYIRESLDKHDARLREVEKEQHRVASSLGVIPGLADNGLIP